MRFKEINIEDKFNKLNMDLRGNITVIEGKSSTGKSLIVSMIKREIDAIKATNNTGDMFNNIEVFDYNRRDIEEIKHIGNKLIIIDNADELITSDRSILGYIGYDENNQYIIIGRRLYGLKVTPNYIATVKTTSTIDGKNLIELQYEYSEGSWW